jgi:hypothetical protein
MEPKKQPLDQRRQTIADLFNLIETLAGLPDVPLNKYGNPLEYPVLLDDDEAGVAEIRRIADALGVPVTTHGVGRPVATPESTHLLAELRIGQAVYSACYIRSAWMAKRDEEQRWLAQRREAESKHDNGFRAPEVVAELERDDPTVVES